MSTAIARRINEDGSPVELEQFTPASPATLFGTDDPEAVLAKAGHAAKALVSVAKSQKLVARIQNKDYPLVECWTLLGSMLGVFPVVTETHKVVTDGGGWEAYVEARTRNGEIVGGAWAQCTRSEKLWANRDDYALRSMAQTRATSKALRMPLGFVMTLGGFEATPAEEMPREGTFVAPTGADKPKGKLATKAQVADLAALLMAHPDEVGRLAAYLGQRETYGTEDLKELTGEHAAKLIEELKAG